MGSNLPWPKRVQHPNISCVVLCSFSAGRQAKIDTKLNESLMTGLLFVFQGKSKARRVKTIYDCQADNDDELTFVEGEVIIVTGEEDQEWWVSSGFDTTKLSRNPDPRH